MFCQAARGREVTSTTFLCLSLYKPEIEFSLGSEMGGKIGAPGRGRLGLKWSSIQVGCLGPQAKSRFYLDQVGGGGGGG